MRRLFCLSIITFIISLFSLNSKEPSRIVIPLKAIKNPYGKYPISRETYMTIEKQIEVKNIFGQKVRTLLEERRYGKIKRLKDTLFAAPILIEKNQYFDVILDTGSVNLWVAQVGSKDEYEILHHYDPNNSTLKKKTTDPFEIQYGTGKTKGVYYFDSITFVEEISYLRFGVASETNFNAEGADGIMGLAKTYTNKADSAIWTIAANRNMHKSFSIKYDSEDDIQLIIGDEHEDFIDNNVTCQLLSETNYDNLLWTCKLYTFGLISQDNKKNISATCGYNFLFDTGSNVMILPKETLEYLLNQLSQFDCYKAQSNDGDQIMCEAENKDNLPNIFVEIGNYYLILDKEDMFYLFDNEKLENNKYRYVLDAVFTSMDTITISIMGQPFFKLFHTKFDYEEKLLKFYTSNADAVRFASVKPDHDKARNFETLGGKAWLDENKMKIIAAVAIAIAAFFIIFIFIKCCKKMCRKKTNSTRIEIRK